MTTPLDNRAEFSATAAAYRRKRVLQFTVLGLSILPMICASFLRAKDSTTSTVCVIFLVIGLLVYLVLPDGTLICPACKFDPDKRDGHFCPICGCDDVTAEGPGLLSRFLGRGPRCEGCGKNLYVGARSGRSYKIHYCRKCGTLLDERGV